MSDEKKWSEISNEISNVAKKIKSHIDEEDLVEDFPRLTEDMVEYWLDLRIDDEILDRSTPDPSDIYNKDISP